MNRILLVVFLVCVLGAGAAQGHEVRPGYLELREVAPETFEILWKVPMRGGMRLRLYPRLPDACEEQTPVTQTQVPGAMVERWSVTCAGGVVGKTVIIDGLQRLLTDVLVRVELADGVTERHILRPTHPSVVIGETGSSTPVLGYLRLGVEHILLGVDHLLFVLGLLLIVGSRWMLLKTITSFTLAHSITLAVATLGFASAPVLPLNAAIALSILFLGPEIVRAWRGETSFTIRHPWVVAFAFGLLHGFGFASGLSTVGLPRGEIPFALLLFNVGVEIGQVAFVLLVVLLGRSFRVLQMRWPRWAEMMPGYVVGGLGAYWTIQRAAVLLGGSP